MEIRIRQGRPLALVTNSGVVFVSRAGKPELDPLKGYRVSGQDCRLTLQLMTRSSVYMVEDKLVQGFLTLPGGHRVGVVGSGYVEQGRLQAVRDLGQLNIRLAREVPEAAAPILPSLVDGEGRFQSTLVISPPGCGKTTLIRDIARQLSWGKPGSWPRHTVAVVDERSEIGAVWQGEPQTDCGPCTDVLDGYPKVEGIAVAIRALAPDVLVTDELGTVEDASAVVEAAAAGIAVLASIHGDSWEAVQKRPGGRLLAENRIFRRLVILSRRRGPGTVEKVQVL
ncbi:MAG: stage III sporulation protein AA [Firmicutes bacterium]|nr:stage III sporulation protein AA [Bacillota bacterium]